VQSKLSHRTLAVDLPGRRNRPADLSTVTIDDAARSLEQDLLATTTGSVVLVGHSAGGIVLPALTARLDGRVEHLVFVAGLCAPHGATVADSLSPGPHDEMAARLAALRARYRGHMLATDGIDHTVATVDMRVAAASTR
jgi:surfactin synthase thioesterase subunit